MNPIHIDFRLQVTPSGESIGEIVTLNQVINTKAVNDSTKRLLVDLSFFEHFSFDFPSFDDFSFDDLSFGELSPNQNGIQAKMCIKMLGTKFLVK